MGGLKNKGVLGLSEVGRVEMEEYEMGRVWILDWVKIGVIMEANDDGAKLSFISTFWFQTLATFFENGPFI